MEHDHLESGTVERDCVLKIDNEKVAVSEAVYHAYWKEREHEKYLAKKALEQELSWQALEADGMPVEVHTMMQPENRDDYALLYAAMATLDGQMQEALWALVCGETTERELAKAWGVDRSTVCRRKNKVLRRLRAILEAQGYGTCDD